MLNNILFMLPEMPDLKNRSSFCLEKKKKVKKDKEPIFNGMLYITMLIHSIKVRENIVLMTQGQTAS